MDASHDNSCEPGIDRPVDRVIAQYLADVGAGRKPDRSALLAQHPEFAAELQQLFNGEDGLNDGPSASAETDKVPDDYLARYVVQTQLVSVEQVNHARHVQAVAADKGQQMSLAEVLVREGIITAAQRANLEKAVKNPRRGISQLGNYKLKKKLGEGGMGAVYLAEDVLAKRNVALKILPRQYASSAEYLKRFQREARAAGRLSHPNIVAAYGVGEDYGQHYFAMEYCEGEPLEHLLQRKSRLPADEALRIIAQVARGLQHAHEKSLIHRDIKPANIFITTDGTAKILDLGLSKQLSEEQSFNTQTGAVLGTPHFMSPEQINGAKNIDRRADIYSLGVTLYNLVTGSTPYGGSNAMSILNKHLNDPIPDPRQICPEITAQCASIIRRMMAKSANDRYQSCAELLVAIEAAESGGASESYENSSQVGPVPERTVHQEPAPTIVARSSQSAHSHDGAVRAERSRESRGKSLSKARWLNLGLILAALAIVGIGLAALLAKGSSNGSEERRVVLEDRQPDAKQPANSSASGIPPARAEQQPPSTSHAAEDVRQGYAMAPRSPFVQKDDPEVAAADAFDKLRKFEGLDANSKAGRIKRLEEYIAKYGDTIVAARARTMLEDLKKPDAPNIAPTASISVKGSIVPIVKKNEGDGMMIPIGQWKSFSVKVVDDKGAPMRGVKIAWRDPIRGPLIFVSETNVDGITWATNLFTSSKDPGAFEQIATVVDQATPIGFTQADKLSLNGPSVTFSFTQKF